MPNLLYSMNSYSMNRQSVGAWLHLSEGADNISVAASPGLLSYACIVTTTPNVRGTVNTIRFPKKAPPAEQFAVLSPSDR